MGKVTADKSIVYSVDKL